MKTWRIVALLAMLVSAVLGSYMFKYKGDSDQNWIDYQKQVGITNMNELVYADQKRQYEEQMATLRGMVDSAATVISEIEGDVVGKEAQIEELEQLRPLLSDKDDIIANLDKQVEAYKKVVVDFRLIVEQKDIQIFSLTKQVDETRRMLGESEAQTLAQKSLRLKAESGWSLERSRTQILRKQGRLSRAVAAGSLSAVGVAQIHGTSAGVSLLSGLATSVVTYILWK